MVKMVLYFDTETTGLFPGKIVQLSYILDYGEKVIGKNFYFAVDYVEPGATMVHGYTAEKLFELSHGKTFSDYADEIYDDFYSARLIVGHNVKFDINFMIAEFSYIDRQFRYNESFDTMKYFTPIMKLPRTNGRAYKYPKLIELMEHCEIFSYDVSRSVMNIFLDSATLAHEARFDTTAMFLCAKTSFDSHEDLREILRTDEV